MKTLADVISAVEALQKQVDALQSVIDGKQPGPKTERPMTAQDAFDVKFGQYKGLNHKEAAQKCGLSYGQVFSCRGNYTFKHVRADWTPDAAKKGASA